MSFAQELKQLKKTIKHILFLHFINFPIGQLYDHELL